MYARMIASGLLRQADEPRRAFPFGRERSSTCPTIPPTYGKPRRQIPRRRRVEEAQETGKEGAARNGERPGRKAETIAPAADDDGGSLLKLRRRESLCMNSSYIVEPDGMIDFTKWFEGTISPFLILCQLLDQH